MATNASTSSRHNLTQIRDIAETQFGIVAGWQLRNQGIADKQIEALARSRRLVPVRPGVYSLGHLALSRPAVLITAVLSAGPGAMLSHQSAAGLFGFNENHVLPIHVLGRSSRYRVAGQNSGCPPMRIHRTNSIHPEDRSAHQGIPVTSVSRTFLDIAGNESERDLRRQFGAATRIGVMDVAAVRRILLRTTGKKGRAKLERVVDRYRPEHKRTKSEMEHIVVDICAEAQIPKPEVNYPVLGMKPDLFWPEFGLIGELDSREFHTDDYSHEEDRERTARFELAGYRVLRLTWAMILFDTEATIRKILEYIELAKRTSTARVLVEVA